MMICIKVEEPRLAFDWISTLKNCRLLTLLKKYELKTKEKEKRLTISRSIPSDFPNETVGCSIILELGLLLVFR